MKCVGEVEAKIFDDALKLVCEKLQWSEKTPSPYVISWVRAIADFTTNQIQNFLSADLHKESCDGF